MAPRQIALPVNKFRPGRRSRVRLLIIHTTEGARTMQSLASFLRRGPNASYHAGSDDYVLAYLVNRMNEAWHCRGANPMADGFVMCAFAEWSEREWLNHPVMLENAAWWLASCARERGIPLRHLTINETRDAFHNKNHPGGVIAHWDYTRALGDGSHWDVGREFPWSRVLNRAREIQSGQTAEGIGEDMASVPQDQWDRVYNELTSKIQSRVTGSGYKDTMLGYTVNADAHSHNAVRRVNETASAILNRWEAEDARNDRVDARLDSIESMVQEIATKLNIQGE